MKDKSKYQFISRGGIKLQAALDFFKIDVSYKIVLDIGSSTGGFVDCLLQNNAQKVYAVDTCYGELAWKLRQDGKVVVMERTNILHLQSLPKKVDLVTIDAGWTKLELILPKIKKFLKPNGIIIALLKPQYQALPHQLRKGILQEEFLEEVVQNVLSQITSLGFKVAQVMESPITGRAGNKEFLLKIY